MSTRSIVLDTAWVDYITLYPNRDNKDNSVTFYPASVVYVMFEGQDTIIIADPDSSVDPIAVKGPIHMEFSPLEESSIFNAYRVLLIDPEGSIRIVED